MYYSAVISVYMQVFSIKIQFYTVDFNLLKTKLYYILFNVISLITHKKDWKLKRILFKRKEKMNVCKIFFLYFLMMMQLNNLRFILSERYIQ